VPEEVVEVPGGGLRGRVEGQPLLLGAEAFLRAEGVAVWEARGGAAAPVAWLAVGERAAAAFVMADGVRAEAPRAVAWLRALGLRRVSAGDLVLHQRIEAEGAVAVGEPLGDEQGLAAVRTQR
jgi:cation transport ATPase